MRLLALIGLALLVNALLSVAEGVAAGVFGIPTSPAIWTLVSTIGWTEAIWLMWTREPQS